MAGAENGIIVYLDDLDSLETCSGCPAQGRDYRGQIPFPTCNLARLETRVNHIPTYREVHTVGIKVEGIPADCPNGYRDHNLLLAR